MILRFWRQIWLASLVRETSSLVFYFFLLLLLFIVINIILIFSIAALPVGLPPIIASNFFFLLLSITSLPLTCTADNRNAAIQQVIDELNKRKDIVQEELNQFLNGPVCVFSSLCFAFSSFFAPRFFLLIFPVTFRLILQFVSSLIPFPLFLSLLSHLASLPSLSRIPWRISDKHVPSSLAT